MGTLTAQERVCCGFARSHVAVLASVVYFFILAVLAAVARRQVGVLAEASTAEGNSEVLWQNPFIVSLACTLVFAVFDLACIALLWLLSRAHDEPTTPLKFVWAGTVFLCVVWLTLCVVGSYLSFGNVKTEIKQACGTLDTHCFSTYEAIQWTSIIMEIVGFGLAGWMLVSTGSHVHPGFFHQSAKSATSRSSGSATSTSRRRTAPTDEEHQLLADGGASLRATEPGSYSLGRRSSSRSRADSRRGSVGEYSLRKSRSRHVDDGELERGRSRSRARDERTSSVAAHEMRRVREEAERAVRSLSHARRAAERTASRPSTSKRTSASRSRSRARRRSEEERSMGKAARGGSRSRSRARRSSSASSSSDASSSDEDRRERKRGAGSRGRSSSRRRR